jgi:uncharacterized protein YjbJ (UPF0337 family)
MCAEVGRGAGNHVKICNRSMRQYAGESKQFCHLAHILTGWSVIARNMARNSDVRFHTPFSEAKEIAMNKDRVAGATKEAVGGIKEKTGKALGDTEMEVEGKAKKVEGKVQNAAGKVEDKVRDAAHRAEDAARPADKGRW